MSLARIFYDLVRTGLHGRKVAPAVRYYWPKRVPTPAEQKKLKFVAIVGDSGPLMILPVMDLAPEFPGHFSAWIQWPGSERGSMRMVMANSATGRTPGGIRIRIDRGAI